MVPDENGVRDPLYPRDRRYQRHTSGPRASAFREGFARGAIDVLRRLWPDLDDAGRARAAQLAAHFGDELT